MKQIKIIIVDDHKIFRQGLKFIMDDVEEMEVVAEAENGKEFLTIIENQSVDIVLMDINMPEMNGVEATKLALSMKPDLKVVVLSMQGDEEYYDLMVEAGVKGFLLKSSDAEELINAVKIVDMGGTYFSQELLLHILEEKKHKHNPTELLHLTEREMEVLKLICEGYNNLQIAEKLFISNRTVERHRANLLSKTNCPNSIAMVMYAIKNNIITIS